MKCAKRELGTVDDLGVLDRWQIETEVANKLQPIEEDESLSEIADLAEDILESEGIEDDPLEDDGARAADHAVDFVAFGKEQLRQIGTVLPGNAGDKGFFCHECRQVFLNSIPAASLESGQNFQSPNQSYPTLGKLLCVPGVAPH